MRALITAGMSPNEAYRALRLFFPALDNERIDLDEYIHKNKVEKEYRPAIASQEVLNKKKRRREHGSTLLLSQPIESNLERLSALMDASFKVSARAKKDRFWLKKLVLGLEEEKHADVPRDPSPLILTPNMRYFGS